MAGNQQRAKKGKDGVEPEARMPVRGHVGKRWSSTSCMGESTTCMRGYGQANGRVTHGESPCSTHARREMTWAMGQHMAQGRMAMRPRRATNPCMGHANNPEKAAT
jgi:hypothetical protein